ncbi:MAG: hypothetical protein M0Z50_08970 [Planctomycetia bacterium]|jgi:hypothetical protein|nr:hypothetical protein [Planctomycetia bacterium]
MYRRNGFFLFDLTLAIVLLLTVASIFAHLVWLYNRDSIRLSAIRDDVRNEQAILYRAMSGRQVPIGKQWVIMPARITGSAMETLPGGSHWIAIRSAYNAAVPTLYALTISPQSSPVGGIK